jgi:hypothetical protein
VPFSLTEDLDEALHDGTMVTDPMFGYADLHSNGYGIIECTPGSATITFLRNNAATNALPVPAVRWTIATGDTNAVRENL